MERSRYAGKPFRTGSNAKGLLAAVEQWVEAIRQEEALASVNHTVAEVDQWENAHFKEDQLRDRVKAAKKKYEDALRQEFYGF
jgi:hypothetical protein